MARDPRRAAPVLVLHAADHHWTAVPDLLSSGSDDRHVIAEMDDHRVAWLRFGDDRLGEGPEPGTVLRADYRVGGGTPGNVGAEAIRHVVLTGISRPNLGIWVRNPLPATGGTDPEPVADAKLAIPVAFAAVRERAITGDDYAELATRVGGPKMQGAAAELVWTGSWYEADVALDPRADAVPPSRCVPTVTPRCGCQKDIRSPSAVVAEGLERYRRMGHDLHVEMAEPVLIDLEVTVCVLPGWIRSDVTAAIRDVLTSGRRRDGSPGFFHADRWTFGQPVAAVAIATAVQAVPGVESAEVTRLGRRGGPSSDALVTGVLPIGPREVAVLESGPGRAASGRMAIVARGGR
jgi:predicted phage baseplate assembly protein